MQEMTMLEKLELAGKIKAIHSRDVSHSKIGLGFEKLDRAVFDPSKAYDRVGELGVKWIRLQSGWARTEKAKGVYDFAWLDDIVDNLISRGLQPWMCLCYGNGIYDEDASKVFGAVGCPPIKTAEQKRAWHDYVVACVRRYAGRITWYEVWNEPDGKWCWKHGVSGEEYGQFVVDTAAAIREADPSAKVAGGVICSRNLDWLNQVLATGAGAAMDALTYHNYSPSENKGKDKLAAFRALCHAYNPKMQLIQGETGTQSSSKGSGALRHMAWTPRKQAKFLLRHSIADLMENVLFLSYFSCMDMIEALNGTVDNKASYLDYGYFGVLGAEFDENGIACGTYTPKPSYYALQNLASVFREDVELCELPIVDDYIIGADPYIGRMDDRLFELVTAGFSKPNGSCAFAYWRSTELLNTLDYEASMSLWTANLKGKPRIVDMLDGSVYDIPEKMMVRTPNGGLNFEHLPVKDYPLLLTFGDFADFQ